MNRPGLSRRAVLAGASVAIPLLEVHAQTAPPRRLVFFHLPNGVHVFDYYELAPTAPLTAPKAMSPFGALATDINVLWGLSNIGPFADNSGGLDDHMRAGSTILT